MSKKILQEISNKNKFQPLGRFLFSYLGGLGVRHCFGIPGDSILPLFKALEEMLGIEAVVTTHEPSAAFGADAYGRFSGLGVLLVTYGLRRISWQGRQGFHS
ncbi:MAG: hypothetical protein JSW15_01350 [Deltaproteobacteria bacterium]|nr:MAG: hypothetical protein JSW15_01350 [Deltaproteobacteria bacterium]